MFCRISALELCSLATKGRKNSAEKKNREFDVRTPFACYRRDARIPTAEFRSIATIQTQEFNFRICKSFYINNLHVKW